MRIATTAAALGAAALWAAAGATPAAAQNPPLGQLEVKAYQPIPKAKTAVQLNSTDTHLSRELRRMVMERLARRGNEIGTSGGNVMRMDVNYLDLSGGISGGGGGETIGGNRGLDHSGANPRMELPRNRIERRDVITPSSGSTLRIVLTLYTLDGGKVIWAASTSCQVPGNIAERFGEAMIDAIFDNPDKNRTGDAGCPL